MEKSFRQIDNLWTIHSYYTLSPWAPDGSGRLLLAGTDPEKADGGTVLGLFDADGGLERILPGGPVIPSFWHTGKWQSWGPGSRFVYHQDGDFSKPETTRIDLETGQSLTVPGDLEGIPPRGEPGLSCSHSLLYAAGYGDGKYKPDRAEVPFQARERHGISRVEFEPADGKPWERRPSRIILSTAAILEKHPDRDRLYRWDREAAERLGKTYLINDGTRRDGLTLMTYCVRWNPKGDRFLFYFGNHCTVKERGEPRLAYVFTADRELKDVRLALDISLERRGVHWGWHPDGERLVGYGPDPDRPGGMCLAYVNWDGTGYVKKSAHNSGGHPSVCPTDHNMIVTDESTIPGQLVFLDARTGKERARHRFDRTTTDPEAKGRNPYRVCLHPVFSPDGSLVLINTLSGTGEGGGRAAPVILKTEELL